MTAEEVEKAAWSDPDGCPEPRGPQRDETGASGEGDSPALELTQQDLAVRYQIPIGTLRDWWQGRSKPDQPTRAYLTIIARDPERVNRTLNRKIG